MVTQLRVYKIKEGLMEEWLEYFETVLVPLQESKGIPVLRAWVTPDSNEFIWMRQLQSVETAEQQEREYYNSPERAPLGDRPQSYLDSMEVRLILPVWPDDSEFVG